MCPLRETAQIRLNWNTEPFPKAYDCDQRVALPAKLPLLSSKTRLVTVSTLFVAVGSAKHPTLGACRTVVAFCSVFITSRVASIDVGCGGKGPSARRHNGGVGYFI